MGNQGSGTDKQVTQNGEPKYWNKAGRQAQRDERGVYNNPNTGMPQVQQTSQPAGVGPNSQGLFNPYSPPQFGPPVPPDQLNNPMMAAKGSPIMQQPGYGGNSTPGNPQGGTPGQGLPTQGGGPANLGNMANQYGENVLSGQFLNPNANPFEAGEMKNVNQQIENAYMTATAPTTQSEFAMAGNFGGSANMDAQSNNEYNLGQSLAAADTQIGNNAYNTGINQMEQTVGNLGGIQQSQYTPQFMPQQYQNNYNAGLNQLRQPYGYQQKWGSQPPDSFTPAQGAGLGIAGLGALGNWS